MRPYRFDKGYTLVEILLAMTLLGILVSATSLVFKPVLDTWALNVPRNEITDSSSYALSRMSSEIAQIKDASSVVIATSGRFKFTDISDNAVDYSLSGTNLMRNSNIMARNVQSLVFSYFDVNDQTLATPQVSPSSTDIWRVRLQVTTQKGGQTETMEFSIHPRNFPRS